MTGNLSLSDLPITDLDLYRQGFVSIYIALTHWCNLRCPHCYDEFQARSGMKTEHAQRIVEQVATLNLPKYFFDLSGGEIMGMPNWAELLETFLQTGKDVAVNTNGTLINAHTILELDRLNAMYPDTLFLSVSLDSHIPEVNAYSRPGAASNNVFEAMRLLKSHNIRFRAAVTLTGKNVETIEDTVRFIVTQYTHEFIIGVLRPVFMMTQENQGIVISLEQVQAAMARILDLKDELGDFQMYHCLDKNGATFCEAGRDRININPNGTITPCYALQTPNWVMGNVYKEPLIDIVRRMHAIHHRRDNRYLLCENQTGFWGEPEYRLGLKSPDGEGLVLLDTIG